MIQCSQLIEDDRSHKESVPRVFDFCGMCSPLSRDQIKSKELSAKGILCPNTTAVPFTCEGAETGQLEDSERQIYHDLPVSLAIQGPKIEKVKMVAQAGMNSDELR